MELYIIVLTTNFHLITIDTKLKNLLEQKMNRNINKHTDTYFLLCLNKLNIFIF